MRIRTYTTVNYNGNLVECLSAWEVLNSNGERINWFWQKDWAEQYAREQGAGHTVNFIPDSDYENRDINGNVVRFANVWD